MVPSPDQSAAVNEMAHRTVRLTDEDERHIQVVQEHFRSGAIPIEVHWNDVIRTALRELAQRLESAPPLNSKNHDDGNANVEAA